MADLRTIIDPFWELDKPSYIPISQKAAANGVATLGADTKIPTAQLPALSITETFVVNSQAAMLGLTAQTGDVAVRTDESKTYILAADPATTLSNWVELLTPGAPVQSVNGQTGNVVLTTTNISEGTNLYYTDARARLSLSEGIGIDYDNITGVITNSLPDQTVVLTEGTGIDITGTYPSFTITNSGLTTTPSLQAVTDVGNTTTNYIGWSGISANEPSTAGEWLLISHGDGEGIIRSVAKPSNVLQGLSIFADPVNIIGNVNLTGSLEITDAPSTGAHTLLTRNTSSGEIETIASSTYALSTVAINTTSPLQGGGDLSTTRTLTILDASASTSGVVTTGFQTFAGSKVFQSNITIQSIPAMASVASLFLVSNGGVVNSRTGAQVLSDIGAAPASGSVNYIQSTTSTQASSNFHISSVGATNGNFEVLKDGSATTAPHYSFKSTAGTLRAALQLTEGATPGLAAWVNNIERLRIDSAGNVGIGTMDPIYPVHVESSGSIGIITQHNGALSAGSGGWLSAAATGTPVDNDTKLGTLSFGSFTADTAHRTGAYVAGYSDGAWTDGVAYPTSLRFLTAAGTVFPNERMRITSTGDVGIATTPSAKLHVNGSTRLDLGSDATGDILYRSSGGNLARLAIGSANQILTVASGLPSWSSNVPSGSANYVQNGTSLQSSSNFYLSGTGRTDGSFQVSKNGAATILPYFVLNNAAADRGASLQLDAETNPGLNFWLHNGTSWVNRATMTSGGSFGIGITSPFTTVHAKAAFGSIDVQNTSAYGAASGGYIFLVNSGVPTAADQKLATIAMGSAPTDGNPKPGALIEVLSAAAWTDAVTQSCYMKFSTTPATATAVERMRINSTGELGIGKTAAAGMTLDVNGPASVSGLSVAIVATAVNLTLTSAHHTVRCTASGITITLPAAASHTGRVYVIINYNTGGSVTTSAFLSKSAVSTTSLTTGTVVWVQSDGTNWYQIN